MLGTRVDRVFQPNRDELILAFRGFSAAYKLLISARANSARVNLTTIPVENPQQPPMLCMLLRKKLQGAKLLEITQPDLERALMLKFDSVNELGDHVELTLAVEIMGRYSNIILVDENGKIIDALKRVDAEMSSERLVLPGLLYRLPPPQDKLSMLTCTVEEIMARIDALPRDMELSKALMSVLQGISPIIAREVENSAGLGHEVYVKSMTPPQRRRTEMYVTTLMETAKNVSGTPHIVIDPQNKPKDFAFMDIRQYGSAMTVSEKRSFSEMLDAFYAERDQIERMRVKSQDLLRLLANHADRLSRKIANQQAELSACAERDTLRIKGDLLSANMYAIQKGETSVKLQNFYDENLAELEIALDPALTPQQNAQKYYKNYRKAKTAEEKLTEQIGLAQTAFARALSKRWKAAVRKYLIDENTMLAAGNCQTSQAMAIYYNIFEPAERKAAFEQLINLIEEQEYHLDVGVLGGRVLFHVLTDFGYSDLAFSMITRPDYPSYGNWIARGATTLWELFQPEGSDRIGSLNHHFWGDISSWFTQALSGIRMAPHGEPNEVDFCPSFISRLTHAEAFHIAPAGRIASAWERDEDDVIVLTVELPSTMHGVIRLESGYVFEDGLAYKAAESGTYRIHSIE